MTFGMNKILLQFSSTAATVLGVYFKLQSFFFMPLFGMNNGIVPIIAFNYGAQQKKRITQTIKIGNIVAFIVMVLGIIAFNLFPEMLLGFFNPSDDLLAIGCKALRTISISFLFAGFCIVFSSVFQALGNGMYSLFVSVSRQLLVLLPCAYLLAMVSGLDAVWWSFPIAEVVSVTVSVLLYRRIYKKKIDVIPE